MRIRRISLRNFGGVEQSEVTFPVDGITVIEGENESGKTTLLRALDAIVEYADNSKSRKIKDLLPVGRDVGPEVEIEIETGEYAFTYRKRWIRDRETVLEIVKPAHEQLTGKEAHDRVAEILEDTLDAELWKALRLDQGSALEQATFTGSALGRALDAVAGGDAAGDHEDALWDRVESEYSRYWTKTGKPKEDLATAKRDLEAATEAAEAARSHVRSLDEASVGVERLTSRAATLEAEAADAETAVKSLEGKVEKVRGVRQLLTVAAAERDLAVLAVDKATSDRKRRTEQVDALKDAEASLESIEGEVSVAEPERDLVRKEVASADDAAKSARSDLKKAQRAEERARGDAVLRRWEIEVTQLRARRDRVEEAHGELTSTQETIEAIAVDAEVLDNIEKAYLKVVELRAAVDRALPVVRIEAKRTLVVSVDGVEVDLAPGETREVTTHGRTEVVVPDTVGFVVTAGSDGTDIVDESGRAEVAFTALCEHAGVSGFEEARAQFDRRTDAERTRSGAHETIKRDLDDLTFEGLVHKVESLGMRIGEYLEARGEEPPLPSDHSAAQEAETRAAQSLEVARETSESAGERAVTARGRLTDFEKVSAGREGKLEIARNAVESARTVLDDAREIQGDDALVETESNATAASVAAGGAVTSLEGQLGDLDAETTDALLVNAQARRDRNRRDLSDVSGQRRELEIRLSIETERGPARLVDEAETNLVEAERKHEAIERRATAAALLHSTFDTHRSAAHRRYIQPFRDEIERLGRIVFGASFEVSLAENLSIETRTLDGETLSFGLLSTGAQEQLGVLSRLACARLVSGDGGAPVVLDDALGWTDPERLDLMGAAISTAADDCQVIILTCVPDRYSAVGKARTVRI